jgi:serine/threonine protein kinase
MTPGPDQPTTDPRPVTDTAETAERADLSAGKIDRVRQSLHEHPQTIGPYRILEPLGEGGMGAVYKAEQRHPIRRTVAIKIIKLGFDTKEVIAPDT